VFKTIAKLILKLCGWKVNPNFPMEAHNCVLIAAPHTTNWDAFYLLLGMKALGIPMKFTIKDQWTKFPFGLLIKPLGGLGIDRSKKSSGVAKVSYIDQMVKIIKSREQIAMVVAAEGTRRLRKKWKMGFYHTAVSAGVPLCFGYLDYEKKEAGIGGTIDPTGDIKADMKIIHAFYKDIKGKYPEKFSLDERYI